MNRLVKGMVIGGIVAASASVIYGTGIMQTPTARRILKKGKGLIKRSAYYLNDVMDMFK